MELGWWAADVEEGDASRDEASDLRDEKGVG